MYTNILFKKIMMFFYFGKGTKNWAWKGTRKASCEQIKREYE